MQSFTSLISIVSLSLLVSSVSSTPIKRSDDVKCQYQRSGALYVQGPSIDAYSEEPVKYFVALSNATTTDSLGNQAKFLTLRKDDYELVEESEALVVDFSTCDSKYIGLESSTNESEVVPVNYGHISPSSETHDSKTCLTYASADVNSNINSLIADSICSFKDDQSQLLNYFEYFNIAGKTQLDFVGRPKNGAKSFHDFTVTDEGHLHLAPHSEVPLGAYKYELHI